MQLLSYYTTILDVLFCWKRYVSYGNFNQCKK